MRKNLAIILAGGSGARLSKGTPKQFMELAGKPIIAYAIEQFLTHPRINDIFLVTHREYLEQTVALVRENNYYKVTKVLEGGSTRQASSFIGVMAGDNRCEHILVHDAARPFITHDIIDSLILGLESFAAVVPGIPASDTIIKIDKNNKVREIPDRNFLRRVQTPQAFKFPVLKKAHEMAHKCNIENVTDDCSLILEFKLADICFIPGNPENIKITYPYDLVLAKAILKNRHTRLGS
jgi:2-C-methyl-D-erythritol 4-phosphate cytidylyltransferase